jgi:hypothetical protein
MLGVQLTDEVLLERLREELLLWRRASEPPVSAIAAGILCSVQRAYKSSDSASDVPNCNTCSQTDNAA